MIKLSGKFSKGTIKRLACYTLFVGLNLFSLNANGQELKKEKEVGISKNQAPEEALKIVDGFNLKRKTKWYRQTNFDTLSYEVKFKHNSHFYSVAFDTTGQILDIEQLVKWKEIEEKHKKHLKKIVENRFDKYKLIKCQIQYTGDKALLNTFFNNSEISDQLVVRFEIELEGKQNASWKKYEFLISSTGTVERERIIVGRSTENLNY